MVFYVIQKYNTHYILFKSLKFTEIQAFTADREK